MKIIGIPLRKPSWGELTAASIMGAGLWVAAVGVLHGLRVELDRGDAGALLVVMVWGCVSARIGIRIDKGQRHFAANLLVSAALLALYQGACSVAG